MSSMPVPVVLLDSTWHHLSTDLVKGDIFEVGNTVIGSIWQYQEKRVAMIQESALVAKTAYADGIIRSRSLAPDPPLFVSAEVGLIAADVVEVTFDIATHVVTATDWVITVDAGGVAITRVLSKGAKTQFKIATPVTAGQAVTIDYNGSGKTVSAVDGSDMTAIGLPETVTNNVS